MSCGGGAAEIDVEGQMRRTANGFLVSATPGGMGRKSFEEKVVIEHSFFFKFFFFF